MNFRCKNLGIAFVLILAVAGTSASAASAAEYHHEASEEEAARFVATNEGAHEFTFGVVGTLSCNTATFTGTEYVSSPQNELEYDAAFSDCTFLGVANVAVKMNGCKVKFGGPTATFGGWHTNLSIVCPPGGKVTVTASGCTVEVGGQGSLQLAFITNVIPTQTRTQTQVSGVTFTASILCPGATGTHSNGTYAGVAIASAVTESEEVVGTYVE